MNKIYTFILTFFMLFNYQYAYSGNNQKQMAGFDYEVTGDIVTIDLSLSSDHEIIANDGEYFAQLLAVDSTGQSKANYLLTDKVYIDKSQGEVGTEGMKTKLITGFTYPPIENYDLFLRLFKLENNYIPLGELSFNNENLKFVDMTEESLVGVLNSYGLSLECLPCRIVVNGDFVNLQVSQVSNLRNGGYSGTLKLKVWATNQPYSGGTLRGKVIAQMSLGQLPGNTYINNINQTLTFNRPADGTYYIVLTLSEYYGGTYYIMDYDNAKDTMTFSTPVYNDVTSGGGAGGGGAFSLSEISILCMLMVITMMSRRRYVIRK